MVIIKEDLTRIVRELLDEHEIVVADSNLIDDRYISLSIDLYGNPKDLAISRY